MGIIQTKTNLREAAFSMFSKEEQENINKLFKSIAGSPTALSFTREQLEAHVEKYLSLQFIARLHDEMANVLTGRPHQNAQVSYQAFIVSLAHLLKGSRHQRGHIVRRLSTENRENTASEEMINLIDEFINGYVVAVKNSPEYTSWEISTTHEANKKFAQVLLQDLFHREHKDYASEHQHKYIPAQHFDEEAIEAWLAKTPLISHMMDTIFRAIFPVLENGKQGEDINTWVGNVWSMTRDCLPNWQGNYGMCMTEEDIEPCTPTIPLCSGAVWDKYNTLLDIPSLLLLNYQLPVELRSQWRMLYTSRYHTRNFATLAKHIMNKGPTVVLIRDKDAHVFGGFASHSWETMTTFKGSSRSFVFSLSPQMCIYTSTNYNENFIYMNMNQQAMPNGMGFGGQLDYFGLWLSQEFGYGHSRAEPLCTTYNSPQFSIKDEFEVDVLEIWGVGPAPSFEQEVLTPKTRDVGSAEANAVFNFVDKSHNSADGDKNNFSAF